MTDFCTTYYLLAGVEWEEKEIVFSRFRIHVRPLCIHAWPMYIVYAWLGLHSIEAHNSVIYDWYYLTHSVTVASHQPGCGVDIHRWSPFFPLLSLSPLEIYCDEVTNICTVKFLIPNWSRQRPKKWSLPSGKATNLYPRRKWANDRFAPTFC